MARYQTRADRLAFAQQMVEALQTQLRDMSQVLSSSTDGNFVQFNKRQDIIDELRMWEKRVIRLQRTSNGRQSKIDLSGSDG